MNRQGTKPNRWDRGQSGNPAGRPRGTTTAAKIRKIVGEKDLKEIIDRLSTLAKLGDVPAAKLLLDRCIPPLKAVELPVSIEGVDSSGSVLSIAQEIVAACTNGQIAPSQAAAILSALSAVSKIRDVEELAQRIAAIEKVLNRGEQA